MLLHACVRAQQIFYVWIAFFADHPVLQGALLEGGVARLTELVNHKVGYTLIAKCTKMGAK